MPDWDPADLLRRFKDGAGLEDASDMDDATEAYPYIADGQEEVVREIAGRYPAALYTAPTLMVAEDATRKTFRFAQVNGHDILPMGWVQIAPRLSAFFSDQGFVGWEVDVNYLDEGTRIRIPGDRAWAGDLYARYVPRPPRITAGVAASLRPIELCELAVNRAVRKWASKGNQRPDIVKVMDDEWGYPRTQTPGLFATWMLNIKRRHRATGQIFDPAQWYLSSPDLGSTER